MRHPFVRLPIVCTAACALAWGPAVQAEDDTIATDRPDFVESSAVVGKGRVQLETSLATERDRRGGQRSRVWATPSLLRIGVAEDFELRFETDGRLRASERGAGGTFTASGWGDVSVGVKWHTDDGDDERGLPAMAWLFHADLPTGSAAFKGSGVRPSVRLVAEWDVGGGYSVGLMPGLLRERNAADQSYTAGVLAVVLGKSLSPTLRTYFELSGQHLASARNGGKVVTFDWGMAKLLSKDLQVDFGVSRGLTADTPDWALTFGLSVRY